MFFKQLSHHSSTKNMPIICNLTRRAYFRYTTGSYVSLLRDLFTPPSSTSKLSHWDKQDHLVFVPEHLTDYVKQEYSEIFIE